MRTVRRQLGREDHGPPSTMTHSRQRPDVWRVGGWGGGGLGMVYDTICVIHPLSDFRKAAICLMSILACQYVRKYLSVCVCCLHTRTTWVFCTGMVHSLTLTRVYLFTHVADCSVFPLQYTAISTVPYFSLVGASADNEWDTREAILMDLSRSVSQSDTHTHTHGHGHAEQQPAPSLPPCLSAHTAHSCAHPCVGRCLPACCALLHNRIHEIRKPYA